MKDSSIEILGNIITALISKGEYGVREYNKYFPSYSISSSKPSIALGWARNYGNNAKKLIQNIYNYDELTIPQGSMKSDIDYVRWAINIADDNRYYYAHSSDPFSFSCSTLVAKALYECGYFKEDVCPPNGDAIGGNDNSILHKALFAAGFKKMPFNDTKMQAGDIMTVLPYHIAISIDGRIMVAANGNGDMVDRSPSAITTYDYKLVGTPRWIFRLPAEQIHTSHSTVDKIDTVGIKDRLNKDWSLWVPTSAEKKVLVKLISTDIGKKCQDELFKEKIKPFEEECENTYTKIAQAKFIYCIIRYLQGKNVANKIFNNCNGKYSLANIQKVITNTKSCSSYIEEYKKGITLVKKYVVSTTSSSSSTTSAWKRTRTATVNSNGINVRSTPEEKKGNILGILNKGQRFEVDGKIVNGWVHVKVEGLGIGYIYKQWVKYD